MKIIISQPTPTHITTVLTTSALVGGLGLTGTWVMVGVPCKSAHLPPPPPSVPVSCRVAPRCPLACLGATRHVIDWKYAEP